MPGPRRRAGAPVESTGMGSSIDIEQPEELRRYLQATRGLRADDLRIESLRGGVSCRTVRVELPTGEAWVLKQALPKLRVEGDWYSDPARIHVEAAGMRWLGRLTPRGSIPEFVFEDPKEHLVAMEAVPRPHDSWKTLLLAGYVDLDLMAQFGRLLGTIHSSALQFRSHLAQEFSDQTYFETLRLEPYYAYSAEELPAAASFLQDLIDETRSIRQTLVHGDFSPKNILVHGGRLVLLDHEVIHWGDGAFDLGFAMAHLLSKAHHVHASRETFAWATRTFWDAYGVEVADESWIGRMESRVVRHTLGCLLARVVGRSKLEYMTNGERRHQAGIVAELMGEPPARVDELVYHFVSALERSGG